MFVVCIGGVGVLDFLEKIVFFFLFLGGFMSGSEISSVKSVTYCHHYHRHVKVIVLIVEIIIMHTIYATHHQKFNNAHNLYVSLNGKEFLKDMAEL